MKKLFALVLAVLMTAVLAVPLSATASSASLAQENRLLTAAEEMNKMSGTYAGGLKKPDGGFTTTYTSIIDMQTMKNFFDSYVADHELTADMVDKIISCIQSIKNIIESNKTYALYNLPTVEKEKMVAYARDAAAVVGLSLYCDVPSRTLNIVDKATNKAIYTVVYNGGFGFTYKVIKNAGWNPDYTVSAVVAAAFVLITGASVFAVRKYRLAEIKDITRA